MSVNLLTLDINNLDHISPGTVEQIKKLGCFYLRFEEKFKEILHKTCVILDKCFELPQEKKKSRSGHGYNLDRTVKEFYYYYADEVDVIPDIQNFDDTM